MATRRCSICKEEKPENREHFYFVRYRDGSRRYKYTCIPCSLEENRQYRKRIRKKKNAKPKKEKKLSSRPGFKYRIHCDGTDPWAALSAAVILQAYRDLPCAQEQKDMADLGRRMFADLERKKGALTLMQLAIRFDVTIGKGRRRQYSTARVRKALEAAIFDPGDFLAQGGESCYFDYLQLADGVIERGIERVLSDPHTFTEDLVDGAT